MRENVGAAVAAWPSAGAGRLEVRGSADGWGRVDRGKERRQLLRCWAGALAGLARSSGQLARVGWPRKEAGRGGKGGGLRVGGRKGLRAR